MADLHRIPPGRAGRLWLVHRRAIAERSVDLLDRKLRILHTEQQRFHLMERRARDEWQRAATDAQTWLVRAVILGGQRELRLAMPGAPAGAEITWAGVMGVRYPSGVRCEFPAVEPSARAPGGAALDRAIDLHREALQAAAGHAAAMAACAVIDAEVTEVKRRLTALTERWLPRLDEARRQLEARLEENERAENARLRSFLRLSGKEDQR
jgi:V/A-type H+-transporting ATPase subunit D